MSTRERSHRLNAFAWCAWSKWIDECKADPYYVVRLPCNTLPAGINYQSFRMAARSWGVAVGGKAHVRVDLKEQVLLLQFCWRDDGNCRNWGVHVRERLADGYSE